MRYIMKKYRVTKESIMIDGEPVYRIKALKSFGNVKKGDLGGFVDDEDNLSQEGDCWIYGDAAVYGGGCLYDNAQVSDNVRVFGNAELFDNTRISGNARIYDESIVRGNANISGDVQIYHEAHISGDACVSGDTEIYVDTYIEDDAVISSDNDMYVVTNLYVPFTTEGSSVLTFFRCKDNTVKFTFRGKSGNIEEFFNIFNFNGPGSEMVNQFFKEQIDNAKKQFGLS